MSSTSRIRRIVNMALALSALLGLIIFPSQPRAYATLSSPYPGGGNSSSVRGMITPASLKRMAASTSLHKSSAINVNLAQCDVSISVTTLTPFFQVNANQLFIPPIEIIGSIDVTAATACWEVSSDASWLVITSIIMDDNDPPNGNGTVNFEIEANFTHQRRIGHLQIGDEVLTVFQGARFDDVPPEHPFFTHIGLLSAHGITSGCASNLFCPEGATTRSQMAVFIIRSLGVFDPVPPAMPTFLDVPTTHAYFAFIEELAARGITVGCSGGNFCPDNFVTREQMAVFIIRALLMGAPPPPPSGQTFADVGPERPSFPFIEEFAARGITSGCAAGLFCPDQFVTRGQTAVFLVRAFNL